MKQLKYYWKKKKIKTIFLYFHNGFLVINRSTDEQFGI